MASEGTMLTPTEAEALISGAHPDPTSVLGPHLIGDGLRIVAFLPDAASAEVIPRAERRPSQSMVKVHDAGLFVTHFARTHAPFPYQIVKVDERGRGVSFDDPYAFPPLLGELDLHLLGEGTQTRAWDLLGAHPRTVEGTAGVEFAVWAPHARWVGVIGDFNGWNGPCHPMRKRGEGGIWELFIPGLDVGARYKFHIRSSLSAYVVDKADPYAFAAEVRPNTASIVTDLAGFEWSDQEWLQRRAATNALAAPISIYEVHLGSWRRRDDGRFLGYRELAHQLVAYVTEMGYTHIELMPITEHPFDESWGYLTTGYFAPTSRYGSPHDFMYFVDYCHRHGIGVFLDWVPSHFAKEEQGLGFFDGAHLYEHADPRRGESEWGSYVFNYGRGEVLTFLLSSARFWLEVYHLDGFRVDAVASMLHLDFLRAPGTWLPNQYGGTENLEAVNFLRRFNEVVYAHFPGAVTMAEESSSWPMVSRPTYLGGLGFSMKWNMGWMHDVLEYVKTDPVYRRHRHNLMTFSMMYHYNENYLLPLSHDEVVHGKSPLVYKAPGDEWQKFATLRLLLAYMWAHPGKKLLFMGAEFAQTREWDYAAALEWQLLGYPAHQGVQRWVRALNALYTGRPELYALDYDPSGFQWIDCGDVDQSVLVIMRRGPADPAVMRRAREEEEAEHAARPLPSVRPGGVQRPAPARSAAAVARERAIDASRPFLIFACNFTPMVRHGYRIGVPVPGVYEEAACSDDRRYGGSGVINEGVFVAQSAILHGQEQAITFTLPPLGASIIRLALPRV